MAMDVNSENMAVAVKKKNFQSRIPEPEALDLDRLVLGRASWKMVKFVGNRMKFMGIYVGKDGFV